MMIFFFGGIMKRVPAFILLIALSFACSISTKAQIFMGKDSARQAQNAAKKQQKGSKKAAQKQRKAMKKYEKVQRRAAKKAQRKAAKKTQRRA
jgi:biopolymer transport protein ExbB/TolQ